MLDSVLKVSFALVITGSFKRMSGRAGLWLIRAFSAIRRLRQDDCFEFKPVRLRVKEGRKERKEGKKDKHRP